MGLVLARIDGQLVHGIVVTQWASTIKAKRIIVVNDQVAQDEPGKATIHLSKPAGTGMSLINTETDITNFKAGKYDSHNVLLVVGNVKTLLDLNEQDIAIPGVNIGTVLDRNDRRELTKNFTTSPEELQRLQRLVDKGIPVSYRFAPSDKEEPLDKFI